MQHFVDETNIFLRSGNGGAGCVSFRREKYIPFGGPDGGDGGTGGSVIFRVKRNLRTLYHLKQKKKYIARNGLPGMGNQRTGKNGEDVYIDVPPGTVIYDSYTGEIVKDFNKDEEIFVFLKGGKGGKGNMNFATSVNQAPRYAQPGLPGYEMNIRAELKLIADIGVVGYPNAGKSTLLSVISKAKPKIANYPFTTLTPNLGVFFVEDESFVMADIPGLIEGASNGVGLGINFLKHIERTKVLLFMINLEEENYLDQFNNLKYELKNYSDLLLRKPYIIMASKMDIENSNEKLEKLKMHLNESVLPVSSITRNGIKELLYKLKEKIYEIENENE